MCTLEPVPANLRTLTGFPGPYHAICREERNLAALLYHLLLVGDNLERFLKVAGYGQPLHPTQSALYFEYAFLRDLWATLDPRRSTAEGTPTQKLEAANKKKREVILELLQPAESEYLKNCGVLEFNTHFGAGSRPSRREIQSPSTWSLPAYAKTLTDPTEILKVSRFKWAFNAKPDLVLHSDHDHALCIEAKLESGEGSYPATAAEKLIFKNLGLTYVGQLDIQRYLMTELLGIETEFVFLVADRKVGKTAEKVLSWAEAFETLELDGQPAFVREWVSGFQGCASHGMHQERSSTPAETGGPLGRHEVGGFGFRLHQPPGGAS